MAERKALALNAGEIEEITNLAERKPLVLIDGTRHELPAGDTIAGGGSCPPNWMASQYAGLNFSQRNTIAAEKPQQNVGLAVGQSPSRIVTDQKPGIQFQTPTAVVEAEKPVQKTGIALSNFFKHTIEQKPAIEVVRMKFDLTHRSGSNSAMGGDWWTEVVNAEGFHNGSTAKLAGSALEQKSDTLLLNYADFPNKASLTISQVNLYTYIRTTVPLLAGDQVRVNVSYPGGRFNVIYVSGLGANLNYLTTPHMFTLTQEEISSWSQLNDLNMDALVLLTAGSPTTVELDAIELEVFATATQNL